jgi:hypothetical protein
VLFLVSLADYNASIIEDRGMCSPSHPCRSLFLSNPPPPCLAPLVSRIELTSDANGMVEALVLWESVANSNWFAKSSMILFLNKADVFSAKIRDPQQQIHSTFPDYNGKPGNYQDGVHYFKKRFEGLSRGQKEVYVHVTTAVRTPTIVLYLILEEMTDA